MLGIKGLAPLLGLVSLIRDAHCYIPAQASNSSLNKNTSSQLTVAWTNGVFSAGLSRQLVADPVDAYGQFTNETTTTILSWTKYSKGVLVHFSEDNTTQAPSGVPWIGMVSCDTNGTTFSLIDDIFTLLRDHGAQAALLYSLTSEGCLMNQDYLQNFEKPIDVYATTDLQSARLIENQFSNVGPSAYNFNSQTLNDSASSIDALLSAPALGIVGNVVVTVTPSPMSTLPPSDQDSSTTARPLSSVPTAPPTSPTANTTVDGQRYRKMKRQASATSTSTSLTASATRGANYLAAVMAASNMTVGASTGTTSGTAASPTSPPNGSPNTGLAMIILYAITGVVTFMFLVVILSGAIRAIRHPERYGPRAALNGGLGGSGRPQQSRAHGLTRAILDTFPVVKFGRTEEEVVAPGGDVEAGKDMEMDEVAKDAGREGAPPVAAASTTASRADRRVSGVSSVGNDATSFVSAAEVPEAAAVASTSSHEHEGDVTSSTTTAAPVTASNINPAQVDDDTTCPICVCEFEEGEDVRILPCDGRHRFHRDCIDPWLLQVSSLCPLCRLDLAAGKEELQVPQEDPEADAIGEQQVISNLREMLRGRRGSTSQPTAAATAGGSVGRNKFFRYVASRRRQAANIQQEAEGTAAAPQATSSPTPSA